MKLEIISPINGKGLGRTYNAVEEGKELNETNYIELGLVVYKKDKAQRDLIVTVEATDSEQNKILAGAGNVTTLYKDNGQPKGVRYYPFYYEFKTPGVHNIKFTCKNKSVDVNITAN